MEENKKSVEDLKSQIEKMREELKRVQELEKLQRRMSGRPVRTSRFEVILGSEVIGHGDVHYCVEKIGIDRMTELRNSGENDKVIELVKVNKVTNERTVVSTISVDSETFQIVID